MQFNYTRSAWISGEVCEMAGKYRSDSCGHKLERELAANDIFPHCPTCHKGVRWTCATAPVKSVFGQNPSYFAFLHPTPRKA